MIGRTISHYRIIRQLGAGGMGVVYLAQDLNLKRQVALKFLPPSEAHDQVTRARLQREAESASALDHPNIATIYEIAEWEGQPFIAMAYYEGATLRQRLQGERLSLKEILSIGAQVASGLAAAHAVGIVHRDIKPANIAVMPGGQVKILDFGLARLAPTGSVAPTRLTEERTVVGTLSYMAPEALSGTDVDSRADVWSLGVVLYEMLSGHLPFSAEQAAVLIATIIGKEPARISDLRSDTPPEIRQLVAALLEKDPSHRTISAAQVAERLSVREFQNAGAPPPAPRSRRYRSVFLAASIVVVAVAGFGLQRTMNNRWARAAVAEAEQLAETGKFFEAFQLAQQAAPYLTDPAEIDSLWAAASRLVTVKTDPPEAVVRIREFGAPEPQGIELGRTPLERIRVPRGVFQWRLEKKPLRPAEDVGPYSSVGEADLHYKLDAENSAPAGMIRVASSGTPFSPFIAGLSNLSLISIPEFWIDKFEVTNAQFKAFVDAGGYQQPDFWKEPFIKDGRTLSWSEAMTLFVDLTGRPGPSTWAEGRFPPGQEQYPVAGVSWYEAAAYATFVGRSLPSIYHWSMAAEQRLGGPVIRASNFSSQGPKAVGSSGAMNRFGTYDMMGNVKEWCSNSAQSEQRYILGGAWDEPYYQSFAPDAQSPFKRGSGFGFRTVKYSAAVPVETLARFEYPHRDFKAEKAVGRDLFEIYRGNFAYDRADLHARVVAPDSKSPDWVREKITFAAAYGNETVPAYLFLPTHGKAPYQTVVFFPGATAIRLGSADRDLTVAEFDFILRSGRAVIYPIYKSTFDRRDEITSGFPNTSVYYRDHIIYWLKDLMRALDYLETRREIDKERIGFYGISWGGLLGPIVSAVEPRLKTSVLVSGGFPLQRSLPEVDPIHFAGRVHIPVLMLNGLYDFYLPVGTSQQAMFDAIGVDEPLKRWRKFESGHNVPRNDVIKEILAWFDAHLGEVPR